MLVVAVVMFNILELIMELLSNYPTHSTRVCENAAVLYKLCLSVWIPSPTLFNTKICNRRHKHSYSLL